MELPSTHPPAALRWIFRATFALVVLYAALPIAMALDRETTGQSIRENQPDLDPSHLDFAINAVLVYTVVLHAIDVALLVWLVLKARAGRRWARIGLTAYLVFVTCASYVSWEAGAQYYWAVLSTATLHVVILCLLWVPASVREFYAAHRVNAREMAGHAATR